MADFNNDSHPDFLCVTAIDYIPVLFLGDHEGKFLQPGKLIPSALIQNASVITAGDINADEDLNLYPTQYRRAYTGGQMSTPFYNANDGYPACLLINDGTGQLTDETKAKGLTKKRFRRTYSWSTEITSISIETPPSSPPRSLTASVARTGWSWDATALDFDDDGDQDICVANGFISDDSTQRLLHHFLVPRHLHRKFQTEPQNYCRSLHLTTPHHESPNLLERLRTQSTPDE
ncbi:MAG: hypothetical protein M2R45_00612 [Verrucomicrobia subdivision 3 bacterium]|nr:hypothetical protein [Limisphaerales bacterium]MCS1414504.1 hypothetical protein [Limisphaerales bacterium]